jgi:hypothetical protein
MRGAGRADQEKQYERADAAPHPLLPCIARRLGAWIAVGCPSPIGGALHRHGRELHEGLTAAGGTSCAGSDQYVLEDCETFTVPRATGERGPGGRG